MMKRWSVAVVAAGTPTLYNGHPSTILMPDGSATAKWWTVPAKWWTVPVASEKDNCVFGD